MKSEITSMIYMKLKWSCEFVIFKNLNRQYMSLSTAYNKEEVIDSISSDGLFLSGKSMLVVIISKLFNPFP